MVLEGLLQGITQGYKDNHLINSFLLPAPSVSYKWSSFAQDELICLQTRVREEVFEVPCLLVRGDMSGGTDPTSPAEIVVIYCHANSEDLGTIHPVAKWLARMLKAHVLVPEYPGYGLAKGRAFEDSVNMAVVTTCVFATDVLEWDPRSIVLYGRSIGTGPAVHASSLGHFGALALITPFTSVMELLREHVGVVSVLAAGSSEWNSEGKMEHIRCATLIVHGTLDDIIPHAHASALYRRSGAGDRRRLILLDKIGHHDMDLLYSFVETLPSMVPGGGKQRGIDLAHYELRVVEHRLVDNAQGTGAHPRLGKTVPVFGVPASGELGETGASLMMGSPVFVI
mmetsp:Transcript_43902/g.107277  ORF Transcript_43902/g.107277 Transcript_43902/m.107277 type:complete len:340 (+) Transcript_43902:353-1372(+)